MRTRNVFRNLVTSWGGQVCVLICNFISRWVIVKVLPIEYLGINGLFYNILTILSFADLGFGISAAYYLYEPLANDDSSKIVWIINFYKKVYNHVGVIVLAVGLLGLLFLDEITGGADIPNIGIIYVMYIVNSAISYFNTHKITLLIADQKGYIQTLYVNSVKIVQIILGIIVLWTTRSYIAYYSLQVFATLVTNILISERVDSMYPYLKGKHELSKDSGMVKAISSNMGAMMIHKFGTVVVNGTDNLLLSVMVSLVSVGLYSNYSMLINNVRWLVYQCFDAMTSSIGNYVALESREKKTQLFYTLLFLEFWIFGFCAICLFVLSGSFIRLWLGEDYLLGQATVFVVVLNFYLQGMRRTILSFRDAEGLFKQDCYKAVLEAVINLVASIYLTKQYGMIGVFLGTVISTVCTCVWLEPFILFRNGLQGGVVKYYGIYLRYLAEVLAAGAITYWICGYLGDSLLMFLCKMVL